MEIQANSLRIGNLFYFKDDETGDMPLRIEGVHEGEDIWVGFVLGSEKDNTDTTIDEIRPIPLSEEILIKAGFRFNETENHLRKDGLIYNVGNRGSWHYCKNAIRDIQFVHQLQNVYFALTGEELKISL